MLHEDSEHQASFSRRILLTTHAPVSSAAVPDAALRDLLDAVPEAVLAVDPHERIVALNQAAERLFGWSEAQLLGEPLTRLFPLRFHLVSGSPGDVISLVARRRDGSEFPAEFSRRSLGATDNALVVVTIRDLTTWRRAQDILFREKEQALVTLASIADGVMTTDLHGTITYLNPTAERLTGWRTAEALGQPLGTVLVLLADGSRQPIEDIPARCLREGRAVDLAAGVILLRRDGTEVPIEDSAAPLRDRNGSTIGVVIVFHDATERRRAARELSHDATHDALTGLVSRKEFERRLARLLVETAGGGAHHALCYLDLDRFKVVNDTSGHAAGDDLLRTVGRLIAAGLRSRDTAGRLGGDEFAVLLENCTLVKAEEIARGLQQAIEGMAFVWEGRPFALGASVGVIPLTAASGGITDVLRAADDACYVAKGAGGNRVHLGHIEQFEGAPAVHVPSEGLRAARLSRAVDAGRFQLFAQPILPLSPKGPARPRCEILLRVVDEHGVVEAPESFLQEIQRERLTPAIDRWVVRQTVTHVGQWHQAHPDCALPLCSINLSVSSLEDLGLVPALRESLTQHRLPPEAVTFEIAEAAALGNFAQLVRLIAEIRAAGCGVGLDDFGSGMASFAHLKALSLDFVKIGGHYVRGVEDPVYGTLVSTVNAIGRIMGIATIADEVENDTILEKLRSLGVEYAQGHAVAPPAPLADADGEVVLPCMVNH